MNYEDGANALSPRNGNPLSPSHNSLSPVQKKEAPHGLRIKGQDQTDQRGDMKPVVIHNPAKDYRNTPNTRVRRPSKVEAVRHPSQLQSRAQRVAARGISIIGIINDWYAKQNQYKALAKGFNRWKQRKRELRILKITPRTFFATDSQYGAAPFTGASADSPVHGSFSFKHHGGIGNGYCDSPAWVRRPYYDARHAPFEMDWMPERILQHCNAAIGQGQHHIKDVVSERISSESVAKLNSYFRYIDQEVFALLREIKKADPSAINPETLQILAKVIPRAYHGKTLKNGLQIPRF
jgi:hypothetical protein